MSLSIRAVAMPEPIKPPPITATFFMFLGLIPISVTLGTCPDNQMSKFQIPKLIQTGKR